MKSAVAVGTRLHQKRRRSLCRTTSHRPDARIVSQPSLPDVNKPLRLYLDRTAPSSRLTMTYVLQDAADRLGMADVDIHDIPRTPCNPAT